MKREKSKGIDRARQTEFFALSTLAADVPFWFDRYHGRKAHQNADDRRKFRAHLRQIVSKEAN